MAKTTFENITFAPPIIRHEYTARAFHDTFPVGILRAVLYQDPPPAVSLNTIQIHPDYRGIGIAKTLIETLVIWSMSTKAGYISGHIDPHMLLKDDPTHFARYLQRLGFTLAPNGKSFRLNLS